MIAIKQTCLLLVAGLWTSALLGSGYTGSTMVGGWTEQNPQGSPKYLKLAHYAVSTQTEGETVYNTVLNLTNVATQEREKGLSGHSFSGAPPAPAIIADGP
ncbi:hypothetical protein HPB51_028469 [Rhipicephalus microplus]|uniref:Uncharacterized protein n=1 Tax=Rhipicephalus microplus TaxID=6941 RepID=A0A9J6CXJ9_RHIMP|nr:hypothetical protein HPB51_028469 [Rhipicephalus microplus]